jgi:hypothetical protein
MMLLQAMPRVVHCEDLIEFVPEFISSDWSSGLRFSRQSERAFGIPALIVS